MIYIDTGFLIGLFNTKDTLHDRALKWAAKLNDPLIVSEYVLWECVNYFSAVKFRAVASRVVTHVTTDPNIKVVYATRAIFESTMQFHAARPDKDWSLTDCASFQLMSEHGITMALSHDRHFEEAGFQALLRNAP
jgi:uncharacterized protein